MWLRHLPLTAFLLAMAVAAAPARAQEPAASHLAAARELVMTVGAYGTVDRLLPEIAQEIRQQTVTRPDLTKDLNEVLKTMDPDFARVRDQGIGLIARAYAKALTEPEIRDALVFFKTASGLKYAQAQADITEDVVESISAWAQLTERDIMAKVRIEMQKRGQVMQ